MGIWSGYTQSLKSLDVEEPIDLYVHRPLAYLFARAAYPTPISPNFITLLSILAGVASGALLLVDVPHHMLYSGLLLFMSAVLDCADGQLARMRKTSSAFGRMLDGVADLITLVAVGPASAYLCWKKYSSPDWLGWTMVLLMIVMIVTTSYHTTMYDHYKNVFLRLTTPHQDGEEYEVALARYREQRGTGMGLVPRFCYPIYLFYLKSQGDYVKGFDPHTSARLSRFPPFDPERAALYRAEAGPLMRVWRSGFGVGSLVFGLALFNALGLPEYLLMLRLLVLNGIFYGYLRPAQRRVSRRAFQRMGLVLPDQATSTT